ncbi:hypothetical protein DY000_02054033 [Brassica cretica]|uniref:Uncharacterized protein n=1 Tax=Brassica cretica TaxID=69181 RepID=A0ABQ7AD47_BRACR|nr:hypothetical protein DY000_02054033 [Brassica cretica]
MEAAVVVSRGGDSGSEQRRRLRCKGWTLKTVVKKSLLVMGSMQTSLWQQG